MRVLVIVLAALAHIVTAFASEPAGKVASVRIICQIEWRDDMLQQPPPESGRSFDLTLPLAALPADATIGDLVLSAEKRAGRRIVGDFINTFRIYRFDDTSRTFQRIEKRRLRGAETFQPHLWHGDIVVFHGIYDRF